MSPRYCLLYVLWFSILSTLPGINFLTVEACIAD